MMDFKELKCLQSQNKAVVLDVNRRRVNCLPLLKAFLKGKIMTPIEISKELSMSVGATYVALRKYEKRGEFSSFFVNNRIHYGLLSGEEGKE